MTIYGPTSKCLSSCIAAVRSLYFAIDGFDFNQLWNSDSNNKITKQAL